MRAVGRQNVTRRWNADGVLDTHGFLELITAFMASCN